ncbi:MAG: hypothetical protein CVT79_02830 [Alphaproteobacteria bacterium HGW-Alphaproteobacteria-18]|nr:MAG: hypothetical protein CVT79_02830 [Alphaproteobacteria bacterium HGW-Alphaproteobacteria-18]
MRAQQAYFSCDGFGNVLDSGDGLTKLPSNWIVYAGDLQRNKFPLGEVGRARCDIAVSEIDQSFPQYWQRKASLLQSRALHEIALKDFDAAFASLDAAQAVARTHSDMYFDRSIGLNTDILRTLAFSKTGQADEALTLANQTLAKRPYAKATGVAVMSALGPEAPQDAVIALLKHNAATFPFARRSLFLYLFENERYDEALEVVDMVAPPEPVKAAGTDLRARYTAEVRRPVAAAHYWIEIYGRAAYAEAALGKNEKARDWLAKMQVAHTDAKPVVRVLPQEATTSDKTRRVVEEQVFREYTEEGRLLLGYWTSLVEARLAANTGDFDAATKHLDVARQRRDADLTLTPLKLKRILDGDASEAKPPSAEALATATWIASLLPLPDPSFIRDILFDGDAASRSASQMPLLSFVGAEARERGDCKESVNKDGTEVICFRGYSATLALSEEQAVLRAAEIGKQRGKEGFFIEARNEILHSVVATNYGVPVSETDLGAESRLTVRFVDKLTDECKGCLGTDEVITALSPVYRSGTEG